MEELALTHEQKYLLRRVEIEARAMSKDELIEALCTSWEARFRLKQTFLANCREAGFMFYLEERHPWRLPETREEFTEVMGFEPTEEEAEDYLREMQEIATMELDMDEILHTPDEEEF